MKKFLIVISSLLMLLVPTITNAVSPAPTAVKMVIDNRTYYPFTINSIEGNNGTITPVNIVVPPNGKAILSYLYQDNQSPSIQLFKLVDTNNRIYNFGLAVQLIAPTTAISPLPPSYKDFGRILYTNGQNAFSSFDQNSVLADAKSTPGSFVCGVQLLSGINDTNFKFRFYDELGEGPPFSHGNYDYTGSLYVPGVIVVQLVEQ